MTVKLGRGLPEARSSRTAAICADGSTNATAAKLARDLAKRGAAAAADADAAAAASQVLRL